MVGYVTRVQPAFVIDKTVPSWLEVIASRGAN